MKFNSKTGEYFFDWIHVSHDDLEDLKLKIDKSIESRNVISTGVDIISICQSHTTVEHSPTYLVTYKRFCN